MKSVEHTDIANGKLAEDLNEIQPTIVSISGSTSQESHNIFSEIFKASWFNLSNVQKRK